MQWEHDDTVRSMLRRIRYLKVDDKGTQQKVDLAGLKEERPEKVVRIQSHGFSSHPPKDSEAIIIHLGGRSDRMMVVGGEHKDHRPRELAEGESIFYDAFKKFIRFFKDRTDWDNNNKPINIKNANIIEVTGSTRVSVGVGGMWIKITGTRIDLGVSSATATATYQVETTGGPSSKVWAEV